ncbi:hypothetical protein Asp14428_32090 [Actinoplanes sp. NBRC 14428]|nr:hypothetical protein Asp14428_32090 [Actinoplanes sp. NBRC 14428]
MNVRMARPAGALLALGVLAAAGCGATGAGDRAPGKPAPAGPKEQLLGALPDRHTGAFHFRVRGGTQPMQGVLDAGKKAFRIDVSEKDPDLGFTLSMKFLVVDETTWMKVNFSGTEGLTGLPRLPKKWMLLDPSRIDDKDDAPLEYDGETDPGEAGAVLRAIVDVRSTGPGTYAGTTDLTRQGEAGIVTDEVLRALGAKAKAVPFEATVDAQGRLTSTIVKVPAAGKTKPADYAVTYDGYGTVESPSEPAPAEQQKATKDAYAMLNA